MKRSPVVIFCYNRLDCLEKMVESLLRCNHVQERDYFFFSDAPNYKVIGDENKVKLVRDYLYSLQKSRVFKSMRIDCATDHLGCRSSVIKGINEIINRFGKIIDIEDDLIVSEDFLDYMDEALDYFESDKSVWSISGFTEPIDELYSLDVSTIRVKRFMSWGFGIWKDRWERIDWDDGNYDSFREDEDLQDKFSETGYDLPRMYVFQNERCLDSWAITCEYYASLNHCDTVCPVKSRTYNIGYGKNAGIHDSEKVQQQSIDLSISSYSFERCQRHEVIDNKMRSISWSKEQYEKWKENRRGGSSEDKFENYYLFMNKWMKQRESFIEIYRFFSEKKIKSIAIYGASIMAERLSADLKDHDVEIAYYIESRKKNIVGKKVYTMDDELPIVDMIVVTPFLEYYAIRKKLNAKCNIPVCSIEKVIG